MGFFFFFIILFFNWSCHQKDKAWKCVVFVLGLFIGNLAPIISSPSISEYRESLCSHHPLSWPDVQHLCISSAPEPQTSSISNRADELRGIFLFCFYMVLFGKISHQQTNKCFHRRKSEQIPQTCSLDCNNKKLITIYISKDKKKRSELHSVKYVINLNKRTHNKCPQNDMWMKGINSPAQSTLTLQ